MMTNVSPAPASAAYWEARYAAGGHSGAGSRGRLLAYKAAFLNAFIADNEIRRVIDLGCGDGALLDCLRAPDYLGVDVSATALRRCASVAANRQECAFLHMDHFAEAAPGDLSLSIDVLYHLIEDAVFAEYFKQVFACSKRFAVIYASNCDARWPAPHVRHRRFSTIDIPGWRLAAHLPNPHAFSGDRPDDTSFADFFVYARTGLSCALTVPGVRPGSETVGSDAQ